MNSAPTTKSARVELGEVLRFHREQRGLKPRRVADMLGCPVEAVGNYEAGLIVPEGKHWDKYKAIVDRRLVAFNELRFRALNESRAEREQIISSMEHRQMATTNGTNGHSKPLTHKPLAGIVVTAPSGGIGVEVSDARTVKPGAEVTYRNPPPLKIEPGDTVEVVTKQRKPMAQRPHGCMSDAAVAAREEWARLQFRTRPRMPIAGPDGLLVLMRQRFGIGTTPEVLQRIKNEVLDELARLPPAVPAGVKSTIAIAAEVSTPPVTITKPPANPDKEIEAAVQLVLDAIPHLRTFNIAVDDSGEASISYTVREVKIVETGGTMKVHR